MTPATTLGKKPGTAGGEARRALSQRLGFIRATCAGYPCCWLRARLKAREGGYWWPA